MQALFYDYAAALATHVNHFTNLANRDNPGILGWELLEGAKDLHSRGSTLQVGNLCSPPAECTLSMGTPYNITAGDHKHSIRATAVKWKGKAHEPNKTVSRQAA